MINIKGIQLKEDILKTFADRTRLLSDFKEWVLEQ